MSQPLTGKRILQTRPAHQSAGWQQALGEVGAHCDSIPMLEIAPLEDAGAVQAIKNIILDFDQCEHAIFVSQNAVHYAFDWLDDYWPQLPQGPRYYGVGAATARAIDARGGNAVTGSADGGMDSEALLALPALQNVDNARIVVFRGQGGRTLIGDTLRERGARVDYCELYRRLCPGGAAEQLRTYGYTPDAITVHSGETLENLHRCIEQTRRLDLLAVPLICPSTRVAERARELGHLHVCAATNAGEPAMLRTLQDALSA